MIFLKMQVLFAMKKLMLILEVPGLAESVVSISTDF